MELILSFTYRIPDNCGKCSADKRGNDKYPYLGECLSAQQKGRSEASRRVYAGTGKGDAKDMYKCQTEPDDKSGYSAGLGLCGNSKDGQKEYKSENDLHNNGASHRKAHIRCGAETVLSKSYFSNASQICGGVDDKGEDTGSCDAA